MRSSNAFFPCRIEWRPSRLLAGALASIGALAVAALWTSGLPAVPSVAASALIATHVAWCVRRELRRPPVVLVWRTDEDSVELTEGETTCAARIARLHRRGGLVRLDLVETGGGLRRLLWWPDSLNAGQRRRLILACSAASGRDSLPPLVAG